MRPQVGGGVMHEFLASVGMFAIFAVVVFLIKLYYDHREQ